MSSCGSTCTCHCCCEPQPRIMATRDSRKPLWSITHPTCQLPTPFTVCKVGSTDPTLLARTPSPSKAVWPRSRCQGAKVQAQSSLTIEPQGAGFLLDFEVLEGEGADVCKKSIGLDERLFAAKWGGGLFQAHPQALSTIAHLHSNTAGILMHATRFRHPLVSYMGQAEVGAKPVVLPRATRQVKGTCRHGGWQAQLASGSVCSPKKEGDKYRHRITQTRPGKTGS